MNELKGKLPGEGILVADGAWGTEMIGKGLKPGEVPELWNLNRPGDVRAIAKSYKEAGADIILTNTFGGSRLKLGKEVHETKVYEVNRRGAELSVMESGNSLVFASVGPTGKLIKPLGNITEEEAVSCFKEQILAFVEAGCDGVIVETMTDLTEIKCAIKAVRENSNLILASSMTFEKGEKGYSTVMGVKPERAAKELEREGVDLLGSNCGTGIEDMIEIAKIMRGAASTPLWIKPNAGKPELLNGKTVYTDSPEKMAGFIPELIKIGVKVIGGCCGTTPEHIRLFKQRAQSA